MSDPRAGAEDDRFAAWNEWYLTHNQDQCDKVDAFAAGYAAALAHAPAAPDPATVSAMRELQAAVIEWAALKQALDAKVRANPTHCQNFGPVFEAERVIYGMGLMMLGPAATEEGG